MLKLLKEPYGTRYQCTECESVNVHLEGSVRIRPRADGTEVDIDSLIWGDEASAVCDACGLVATAGDFASGDAKLPVECCFAELLAIQARWDECGAFDTEPNSMIRFIMEKALEGRHWEAQPTPEWWQLYTSPECMAKSMRAATQLTVAAGKLYKAITEGIANPAIRDRTREWVQARI